MSKALRLFLPSHITPPPYTAPLLHIAPPPYTAPSSINVEQKGTCPLIAIQDICQLILECLFYEEAILYYRWFECKEPTRPSLKIKEIYETLTLKSKIIPY